MKFQEVMDKPDDKEIVLTCIGTTSNDLYVRITMTKQRRILLREVLFKQEMIMVIVKISHRHHAQDLVRRVINLRQRT